ncbi:MAG: hypothetical protein A2607_00855 [Candidatus Vogelbacteria bacterium RIFOXYD1_FULL_42_15]|uniref:PrgI family protein n=1 Tax=Candidatus Vogelbacteria bacterium RIFOXYD1_FULL_42_15 TaxID=1802437 RepID=A0A1G2QFM0_9BACT|nr:MAG: hypothetical protein A2607_00855 [Candidatus Vogelbacteria bacterium RIFOXYD1_FULL_42_15]
MNFQVPQFIEIEDKVIGPLTFRQFIYLAGGGGLSFLFYAWFGLYLGAVPIALIAVFALALAFYKINDRPFIYAVESFIRYAVSNKLYLWKKRVANLTDKKTVPDVTPKIDNKTYANLPKNRLHELAWSLNIKETGNKNQENNP